MALFKTYLHKDLEDLGLVEDILYQCGIDMPDDEEDREDFLIYWAAKIGEPFYEVCLNCELNVDTGAVAILGID